jgi:hypothetical protein
MLTACVSAGPPGRSIRAGVSSVPISRDSSQADRLRGQLLGLRRHDALRLDEVLQVGRVLFGDPQAMSFYGLPPAAWYARGVRLLGRTCVEATPDVTAGPIARTVHAIHGRGPRVGVVDLFAGSGNLMLHIADELLAAGCGRGVWRQTDANLRVVGATADLRHGDWLSYFADPLAVDASVYVVSPPWGAAFSFAHGLDITRTSPPIPLIIDMIAARDRSSRRYAVVQHTPLEPVLSAAAVTDRHPVVGSGRGCFVVSIH